MVDDGVSSMVVNPSKLQISYEVCCDGTKGVVIQIQVEIDSCGWMVVRSSLCIDCAVLDKICDILVQRGQPEPPEGSQGQGQPDLNEV